MPDSSTILLLKDGVPERQVSGIQFIALCVNNVYANYENPDLHFE